MVLFESGPGLNLVLLPDEKFTIVAVSNAYLRATKMKREEIIGMGFPKYSPTTQMVINSQDNKISYIMHDVTEFVQLQSFHQFALNCLLMFQARTGAMEAEIFTRTKQIQKAEEDSIPSQKQ